MAQAGPRRAHAVHSHRRLRAHSALDGLPAVGMGHQRWRRSPLLSQALRLRHRTQRAYPSDRAKSRRQRQLPHRLLHRLPATCARLGSLRGPHDRSRRQAPLRPRRHPGKLHRPPLAARHRRLFSRLHHIRHWVPRVSLPRRGNGLQEILPRGPSFRSAKGCVAGCPIHRAMSVARWVGRTDLTLRTLLEPRTLNLEPPKCAHSPPASSYLHSHSYSPSPLAPRSKLEPRPSNLPHLPSVTPLAANPSSIAAAPAAIPSMTIGKARTSPASMAAGPPASLASRTPPRSPRRTSPGTTRLSTSGSPIPTPSSPTTTWTSASPARRSAPTSSPSSKPLEANELRSCAVILRSASRDERDHATTLHVVILRSASRDERDHATTLHAVILRSASRPVFVSWTSHISQRCGPE